MPAWFGRAVDSAATAGPALSEEESAEEQIAPAERVLDAIVAVAYLAIRFWPASSRTETKV